MGRRRRRNEKTKQGCSLLKASKKYKYDCNGDNSRCVITSQATSITSTLPKGEIGSNRRIFASNSAVYALHPYYKIETSLIFSRVSFLSYMFLTLDRIVLIFIYQNVDISFFGTFLLTLLTIRKIRLFNFVSKLPGYNE